MEFNGKNIVIGGTGFIGSALVQELVRRGKDVVSVSRHLPEEKKSGVEYVVLDIASEKEKFQATLGRGNRIFLLSGQNYVDFDVQKELGDFSKILEIMKASLPEKVFFTSSTLVYGECETPASEDHALDPQESYSAFKVSCEQLLQEKLVGIPVGILRLANVYGSEKNKGFVGLVFKKFFTNDLMRVNGDGLQERDYIFLDDVVSSVTTVAENLTETDIINISTGKSETLIDVIGCISQITGKKVSYEITGIPVNEVNRSQIKNTRLREKYGYTPETMLQEGLQKTWERYQESRRAELK